MNTILNISIRMIAIVLLLMSLSGCNEESSSSQNTSDSGDLSSNTIAVYSSYSIVDPGQAICYDDMAQINCPTVGEVFYGQDAQVNRNQPNYTDNGDVTITDNVTGLMWQQTDSDSGMDWENALAYAESSTLAGYDDWRLPNVKELQSIVDYTRSPSAGNAANIGPAIDTGFFEITELPSETTNYSTDYGYFWTSTSAYFGTNGPEYYYAWYVPRITSGNWMPPSSALAGLTASSRSAIWTITAAH